MNNVFMGALPEMDGGYRDTADGSEGRVPRYSATNATSSFNTTGGNALYSPAPQYDVAPPPADAQNKPEDSPAGGGTTDKPAPTDTPVDEKPTGDESGDGTGTKISPVVLLGAAALIYFVFFRKKS